MKSNADTELDLEAVKHAFSLGKNKPVKARIVDRKIMIFGLNLTKESSIFHSS